MEDLRISVVGTTTDPLNVKSLELVEKYFKIL